MKMAAMASYRAVPSMLIVAPIGRMNLLTNLLVTTWVSILGNIPADPWVDFVFVLKKLDGDRKGCAA